MINPEFEAMVREAVLAAHPGADDALVSKTLAGIEADPTWSPLLWMSKAIASGALATALAARSVEISNALRAAEGLAPPTTTQPSSTSDAKTVAARFDYSEAEWKVLPPAKKRELVAAAAAHDKREKEASDEVATLKLKIDAGAASLEEKLTWARSASTKAERKDPAFIRAQQERASTSELEKLIRGHEQVYASGQYPQVLRDEHRRHAERLRAIIKEREAANA